VNWMGLRGWRRGWEADDGVSARRGGGVGSFCAGAGFCGAMGRNAAQCGAGGGGLTTQGTESPGRAEEAGVFEEAAVAGMEKYRIGAKAAVTAWDRAGWVGGCFTGGLPRVLRCGRARRRVGIPPFV
jgi:hypothetical protein